ncbi:hypothetical protein FACS1894125_3050 [Actinomycetota bacterium]|nr:hypothetical protein FACS1894125_3050 [Actinomycetota bacterium]
MSLCYTIDMSKKNKVEVVEVTTPKDLPTEVNFGGKKVKDEGSNETTQAPVVPIVIGAVVALVVIIALIVALSGIGGGAGGQGFGNTAALSKISVFGAGQDLKVDESTLAGVENITEDSGAVIAPGGSEIIEVGKQVNVNYLMYVYATDEMIAQATGQQSAQGSGNTAPYWQEYGSSWDQGGSFPATMLEPKPADAPLDGLSDASAQSSTEDPTFQQFSDILVGQTVGTVFAYYIAPKGSGAQAAPPQLLICEATVQGEVGSDPDAPEVSMEAPADAPIITFDEKGTPTKLTTPETFKETEDVVVKVLKQGDGATVAGTDTVSVKYAGFLLDGKEFDSSFKKGDAPTPLSLESVIKGWKAGLAGQKVGSQVEILIPSQYGYGSKGAGQDIPADAYLVFYVDIVSTQDAKSAAAQQQQQGGSASSQQQQQVDPQTGLPAGYTLDGQGNVVGPDGSQVMNSSDYQAYLQQMQSGAGQ